MKPRTKSEREVASLIASLPPITKKDEDWLKDNAFYYKAHHTGGDKYWCECCGGEFESEKTPKVCPVCGKRLGKIADTRKRKTDEKSYGVINTTIDGKWQVMRFIQSERYARRGMETLYSFCEVIQLWFAPGNFHIVARRRNTGYFVDAFLLNSPLELRKQGPICYNIRLEDIGYSCIKTKRTIPMFRNMKFDNKDKCGGTYRVDLYKMICKYPMAETMAKLGFGEVCGSINRRAVKDYYFTAAKIAIRNHYPVLENVEDWLDMIEALQYLGKDLHNAFYVCPKNLSEAHDEWIRAMGRKKEKERRAQEEAERRRKAKEEEAFNLTYVKERKRFFGMILSEGGITISVLKNVEEFREEGNEMHHCVYENLYFKRLESLIMSAKVDGKRTETIEFDLRDYKILQCRGVHNKNSKHHDRIVSLVNKNIPLIKKFNTKKRKTCSIV